MAPTAFVKSRQKFMICTPIGTDTTRVEDDFIVGVWGTTSEFFGLKARTLVEDFLNWDSAPKSIARFTNLYAPLIWEGRPDGISSDALPSPGMSFRFHVSGWRSIQSNLRYMWESLAEGVRENFGFKGYFSEADSIGFRAGGQLVFRASSLRAFLIMEMVRLPAARFRKCGCPECQAPYFIAPHLKQRYCSSLCAKWAQSKSKKNWWKNRGPKWRPRSEK